VVATVVAVDAGNPGFLQTKARLLRQAGLLFALKQGMKQKFALPTR
jgi:hypothetical protein